MQHHRESGFDGVGNEVEFGFVGEHRLGNERPAGLDQPVAGLRRDAGGLVRMRCRILRPSLLGDLVGIDEGAAGEKWSEREGDEGGFSGAVATDDQIETFQDGCSTTTDVPSGRCSTRLPCSSSATVVMF